MSPIISLIIKQLPSLLPVVESLVKKTPTPRDGDDRLAVVEQSLDRLIERSQSLEARVGRMMMLLVFAVLLALVALIAAFVH